MLVCFTNNNTAIMERGIGEEMQRIVVFDILQWFELRLCEKYAPALHSVFHKVKSVLLLLKSIRVSVNELVVSFFYLLFKCSH